MSHCTLARQFWYENAYFLFSPIIHNKKTENAHENGHFRKRFHKWSLKSHRSEHAPFLVWVGKKRPQYTVISISFGLFSADDIGENASKSIWTGEKKTKNENASVVQNILLRFRWDENGYL